MSIQQAILFGGWSIPTIESFREDHFNPNNEKGDYFCWMAGSHTEGCGTHIRGIAKQMAVIGKSCGDVGKGMYSGHGYFMHYPAQHDGTGVTRRRRGMHGGILSRRFATRP